MNEPSDPAKARFLIIQLLRLTGLAMAAVGVLAIAGKIALPVEAGYVLFAVGLLVALFMPTVLSKIWKTPVP